MLSLKGGTPGICGAFDFSEEFLIKIPTVGLQNLGKSDQISPTFQGLAWFSDEKRGDIIDNPHNPHKVRCVCKLLFLSQILQHLVF